MPIDFALGAEQRALQEAARVFARGVLADVEATIASLPTPEERSDALRPFYARGVASGLLRALVDPSGPGLVGAALMAEELAAVDVNVASALVANRLAVAPVLAAGTPEQIERLLTPLRSGTGAPLAACSEVDLDTDAAVQAVAERDGEHWVLRGWKHETANGYGWHGQGADLYVVACRTDPVRPHAETLAILVVPGRAPGVHITGARDTAGHRATVTPRIHFDDVRVPAANLIGAPGQGAAILREASAVSAALVGALATGVARAAFDRALAHARAAAALDEQAVGFLLTDIKGRIEAIRSLVWRACAAVQVGGAGASELAVASKIFASETAVQAVWDAMRVVGSEAYGTHLPLSRLLADVAAYPLLHGSNLGVRRRHLHALLRRDDYDALGSLKPGAHEPLPAALAV
jgi:nitroalkane oxidase